MILPLIIAYPASQYASNSALTNLFAVSLIISFAISLTCAIGYKPLRLLSIYWLLTVLPATIVINALSEEARCDDEIGKAKKEVLNALDRLESEQQQQHHQSRKSAP